MKARFKNILMKGKNHNMGVRVLYVGRIQQYRSLSQNIALTTSSYKLTDGYFGSKGSSRGVREIHARNHEAVAKDFFNKIARGGVLDLKTISGGVLSRMKDGTIISYRKITSSSNSPAVEIRFRKMKSKHGINDQKIHFVQVK